MPRHTAFFAICLFGLITTSALVGCPSTTPVKQDEAVASAEMTPQDASAPPEAAMQPEPPPPEPAPQQTGSTGGGGDGSIAGHYKEAIRLSDQEPLQALKELEQVLQKDARQYRAWYNIGVLQDRLNNLAGSQIAYTNALRIKPDFAPATINLMRVFLRRNQDAEAMNLIAQKIREYPQEMSFQNAMIYLYIRQGRLEQAEQMARTLRKKDEKNAETILNMGLVWYKQRKYELSRTAFSLAADADKNLAEPHYYLGFAYQQLKDISSAITHLQKAIERRKAYPEAHNFLGILLMERGKVREALEHFRSAVRYAPRMWDARRNLGIALNATQDTKGALEAFLQLNRENPAYTDVHYNLGILYLDHNIGGNERAVPISRFAQAIPPDVQGDKNVLRTVDEISRYASAAYHLQAYVSRKSDLPSDAPAHRYLQDANKRQEATKKSLDRIIQGIRRKRLKGTKTPPRKAPPPRR